MSKLNIDDSGFFQLLPYPELNVFVRQGLEEVLHSKNKSFTYFLRQLGFWILFDFILDNSLKLYMEPRLDSCLTHEFMCEDFLKESKWLKHFPECPQDPKKCSHKWLVDIRRIKAFVSGRIDKLFKELSEINHHVKFRVVKPNSEKVLHLIEKESFCLLTELAIYMPKITRKLQNEMARERKLLDHKLKFIQTQLKMGQSVQAYATWIYELHTFLKNSSIRLQTLHREVKKLVDKELVEELEMNQLRKRLSLKDEEKKLEDVNQLFWKPATKKNLEELTKKLRHLEGTEYDKDAKEAYREYLGTQGLALIMFLFSCLTWTLTWRVVLKHIK